MLMGLFKKKNEIGFYWWSMKVFEFDVWLVKIYILSLSLKNLKKWQSFNWFYKMNN